MRSSETAQVFFDNVHVPQKNLIGQEGMGFMMQMMQFQEERLFAAASNLTGLEKVINETIAYARERQVFGMSLIDNQSVHFRLAEQIGRAPSELQSLMRISYDVFCLKKKKKR